MNIPTITSNALLDRRLVGRSRKTKMVAPNTTTAAPDPTIPFAEDLATGSSDKMQKDTRSSVPDVAIKPLVSAIFKLYTAIKPSALAATKPPSPKAINESEDATSSNNEDEINELIVESTIQTRAKLDALIASKMTKQFLHVAILKRKRDSTNEEERDEHRDKITRAMLALLAQDLDDTINDE